MKLLSAIFVILGLASFTKAATITFNFNDLAANATGSSISNPLTNDLNNGLGCNNCATVSVGAGAIATYGNAYTGDGHVEGNGTAAYPAVTLGDSNGCTVNGPGCSLPITPVLDTYLRNIGTSLTTDHVDDRITIAFTGISITSLSFDYEIFPDGSSGQPPDLIFQATDSKGNTVSTWTQYGVTPGTNNVPPGTNNGSGITWSTSVASGASESNAQRLGTWSGNFGTPVTSLSFIDWPATIGIDNLKITTPSAVPEPSSVVFLGTVAALLLLQMRGRRKKA